MYALPIYTYIHTYTHLIPKWILPYILPDLNHGLIYDTLVNVDLSSYPMLSYLFYGISSTHTNWYIVWPEIAGNSEDISLHTCILVLALVMDFLPMLLIISNIFILLADQCSSFLQLLMQINLFLFPKIFLVLTWPLPHTPAILYVWWNSGFLGSSYKDSVMSKFTNISEPLMPHKGMVFSKRINFKSW